MAIFGLIALVFAFGVLMSLVNWSELGLGAAIFALIIAGTFFLAAAMVAPKEVKRLWMTEQQIEDYDNFVLYRERPAEPPDHVAPQAIVEGRRNEDWSMEVVGQYPLSGDAKCDIYRCVIDVPVFNGSVRFEGSCEDITALEALLERVEITGIRHKL